MSGTLRTICIGAIWALFLMELVVARRIARSGSPFRRFVVGLLVLLGLVFAAISLLVPVV